MFDGSLPRDDHRPETGSTAPPSAWTRELAALLLAVALVSILGAVLFPDGLSYPGARF